MEKRPFADLGVSQEILKAVHKLGYEEASPIQTAVIPAVLQGRDVVGQSATGSGKTAAFAIPAIEIAKAAVHKVQVLILCPTRELAVQVAEETGKLLLFKRGLNVVPIYGGRSYDRQFRALAAGVQIVIGTPGRVMDHMERGTLKLDALRLVVPRRGGPHARHGIPGRHRAHPLRRSPSGSCSSSRRRCLAPSRT